MLRGESHRHPVGRRSSNEMTTDMNNVRVFDYRGDHLDDLSETLCGGAAFQFMHADEAGDRCAVERAKEDKH